MANFEVERVAIEHVMQLEREAGRCPEDVHLRGVPYDIESPPRKIEVKAFSESARGKAIPLEHRQFEAAKEDPDNYYVYVVDNVAGTPTATAVRVLHGPSLRKLLDRCRPSTTYWPTFRTGEYDETEEGVD
ncbi:DUF3883 domain-containing protein [Mycolicibacterium sp. OfavD-34-C]|uniref:DUF3883 domain-containing protein n=1 Tax=Mycolicibacterium sp. OfavD-34-C TaxID=2917746 RepID=UPI001EF6AEA8|nr:DUF3883 domain-containing protein [Mycolicibacterium sp. OfavD-34-C]MCG7583749.1 DUF3883 domain-containing protein [Mycolicibacterium sp. OfavD-34-C]